MGIKLTIEISFGNRRSSLGHPSDQKFDNLAVGKAQLRKKQNSVETIKEDFNLEKKFVFSAENTCEINKIIKSINVD